MGLAFYVSNLIRLTLDLGFAMAMPTGQEARVGFTAAFGVEPSFRTPKAALRPFVVVQVGFGKLLSNLGSDFALLATLGGGAEYFFSPNFSVNLRALLSMPFELTRSDLSFMLFTPGLGATVYF